MLDSTPLREALEPHLDDASRAWLDGALQRAAADPAALPVIFPAVGRKVGRGPLEPGADLADVQTWTVDDAARVLLVVAAGPATDLDALYHGGDPAERRGVLRALAFLDAPPSAGPGLVDDAIRTNDASLVAAAFGPYALATLDDAALEQAVLKCVFVGIPLAGIDGLEARATPTLARMLASYAHERVAAGRLITPDVWPFVARFPPEAELALIAAEREHATPDRRAAADRALADFASTLHPPTSK